MGIYVLKQVVLSYPQLFEPKLPMNARPGQKPRYSCVLLIPRDMDITEIQEATYALLKTKWGDRTDEMLTGVPPQLKWPFRTDNTKQDGSKRYDETKFKCFISTWSENPPGLVDRYADPSDPTKPAKITVRTNSKLYAGCIVNVSLNPFIFDQTGNRGASLGLQNVQHWADGDRLDNRADGSEFEVEQRPAFDLSTASQAEGQQGAPDSAAAGAGSRRGSLSNLFS